MLGFTCWTDMYEPGSRSNTSFAASSFLWANLGVRALDVGTGPGALRRSQRMTFFPRWRNTHRPTASAHWRQPPEVTCIESAPGMNHIRHLLAERLATTGAPHSVIAMTGGLHDFGNLHPGP